MWNHIYHLRVRLSGVMCPVTCPVTCLVTCLGTVVWGRVSGDVCPVTCIRWRASGDVCPVTCVRWRASGGVCPVTCVRWRASGDASCHLSGDVRLPTCPLTRRIAVLPERQTLLSPVIMVGPQRRGVSLKKPLILSFQHSASIKHGQWSLAIHTSDHSEDEPTNWQVRAILISTPRRWKT